MKDNAISTENRILDSAYQNFLLLGYHGTTLHQIAKVAGVSNSAVHYYFRSKERLYASIVKRVIDSYFDSIIRPGSKRKDLKTPIWFLITEMYNNTTLFEETIKKNYPEDWDDKLHKLSDCLQLSNFKGYNAHEGI